MSKEPTAEQIEAVARAIYDVERAACKYGNDWTDWDDLSEEERWPYGRRMAHAAIAAMNAEPSNDGSYRPEVFEVEDSFWGLVTVARKMLDRHYPEDLIGEYPKDPGAVFVAKLHEALAPLPAEPLTSTPEPSTTETGRQPNIQSPAGGPPERIEEEWR